MVRHIADSSEDNVMKSKFPFLFLALAAWIFIFAAPVAQAQEDASFVKYRQRIMKSQTANWGAIKEALKNKLPVKTNLAGHARIISQNANMIATAFKKEVTEGKTDAKAEIWEDMKGFQMAAKKLARESAKLAKVLASGDGNAIKAQMKNTGKACGDCHKKFRKKKENSYKRKK